MVRAGDRVPHDPLQIRCRNPLESHQNPIVQRCGSVMTQPLKQTITNGQPLLNIVWGSLVSSLVTALISRSDITADPMLYICVASSPPTDGPNQSSKAG